MNRGLVSGALVLIGVAFAALLGCDDEKNPVAPTTGSIVITPVPDDLDAPWTLIGPAEEELQGHGIWRDDDMKPGEYRIAWGKVTGWHGPPPVVRSLSAGRLITFSGEYVEGSGVGTIVIDAVQDFLDPAWELMGPDGFQQSGTGDGVVSDIAVGSYTVEWKDVTFWVPPENQTVVVETDEIVVIEGTYRETVGTVVIEPGPAAIEAPWILEGPDEIYVEGVGSTEISDTRGGYYTLAWMPVQGWLTPPSVEFLLEDGATENLGAVYKSVSPTTYRSVPPNGMSVPTTFTMGSTFWPDESPHEVTLTRAFWMADSEVTRAQYVDALQWAYDNGHLVVSWPFIRSGLDGSSIRLMRVGPDPTTQSPPILFDRKHGVFRLESPDFEADIAMMEVTWYGAAAYCDWLNLQQGLPPSYNHYTWVCNEGDPYSAEGYRLPTEAEWEFACRAGTTTHFNSGDCIDRNSDANFWGGFEWNGCPTGPYGNTWLAVKSFNPNAWGLYDMHGNAREWCNDWYGAYAGPETDPVGVSSGATERVVRGGYYYRIAYQIRSAYRFSLIPEARGHTGFRPVRTVQ